MRYHNHLNSTSTRRVQSFGRLDFNRELPRFHGSGSAGCRVAHASRVSHEGVPAIANFPSSLKSVLRFLLQKRSYSLDAETDTRDASATRQPARPGNHSY